MSTAIRKSANLAVANSATDVVQHVNNMRIEATVAKLAMDEISDIYGYSDYKVHTTLLAAEVLKETGSKVIELSASEMHGVPPASPALSGTDEPTHRRCWCQSASAGGICATHLDEGEIMISAFLSLPIPVQISIVAVIVIPILLYWIGNLRIRLREMRTLERRLAEFERAGLGSAEGMNLDALLTRQTMDSVSDNFLSQLQHDLRNRR